MINATQKEGIRYLEHCRIIVNDERLSVITKEDSIEKFYSIPYFNLCVILLGEGTSITQKAAKFLASEGILLGFVGSGGTPLFMASQNEYRPTTYFNNFIKLWIDEASRFEVAILFQKERIAYIKESWSKIYNKELDSSILLLTDEYLTDLEKSKDQTGILISEAKFTKSLYGLLKKRYDIKFKREQHKREDPYNKNLDDGNYLAYGLSGVTLWTLGIPFSMSVLHGKTRNGGLVFDVADIIKDGIILPHAFVAAEYYLEGTDVRKFFIEKLDEHKSLEYLFKTINKIVMKGIE